jgi:O-antigen ligase
VKDHSSKGIQQDPATPSPASSAFAAVAGLFFFIVIIKFGDPVVLDHTLPPPANPSEFFYDSWPSRWGTLLLLPLLAMAISAIPWQRLKLRWYLLLPAIWLGWQFVSATQTVSQSLTAETLTHFTICIFLFYLGYFALDGNPNPWLIWTGIGLALCWTLRAGMEQHFGGLEETRKMLYSTPGATGLSPMALKSPEFQKRMASDRIYSTFVYANAFAGGLVLLLPVTLVFLWRLSPKVRRPIRIAFVAILGGCGLACLYWSGSKAGWLVALTAGLIALWHSALPRKWKLRLIGAILVVGLLGFAVKYAAFFQKQRNSVGARFIYWRGALQIIAQHPIVGTGPGTFSIPFAQIKPPDAEMARLCHNDYLEQGSDSGVFGLISYATMILTFITLLYRYSTRKHPVDWLPFAVWLGLFSLALHSLVEFHLYIPSLAWPMFFLMGWLLRLCD